VRADAAEKPGAQMQIVRAWRESQTRARRRLMAAQILALRDELEPVLLFLAACTIQRQQRRRVVRRSFSRFFAAARWAVRTIQRWYRGYRDRCRVLELQIELPVIRTRDLLHLPGRLLRDARGEQTIWTFDANGTRLVPDLEMLSLRQRLVLRDAFAPIATSWRDLRRWRASRCIARRWRAVKKGRLDRAAIFRVTGRSFVAHATRGAATRQS